MLKNSKGLLIGLAVLVVVGIAVFMMKGHPSAGVTETSTQLAATETPAAAPPAPATEAPAAPAAEAAPQAPAASTAPAAPMTEAPAVAATNPTDPTAVDNTPDIDIVSANMEHSLGDPKAPVTVIEYASLSCPHCAYFATKILPDVKAKLIDTGKMRLIFRDFPLDRYAMSAAKLARCAPPAKYFDFVEVIFQNRDRWLASKDPEKGLMQLGSLAGMSDEYMKNCIGNAEIENDIVRGLSEAQGKFQVKATPTFIFNYGADSISGAQEEPKFEEIVNRLTPPK